MLISHQRRFVFVHIFKTGGTSITHALIHHARLREQLAVQFVLSRAFIYTVNALFGLHDRGNEWFTGLHKHATATEIRAHLGERKFAAYFKFAFVRNPWDWQCSVYHYVRGSRHHRDYNRARSLTLREFIQYQIDSGTPRQTDFLTDSNGNVIVDWVGRFEFLQQDFDALSQRLGLPALSLRHLNASARPRNYAALYDDETAALVASYFAGDIARFGYALKTSDAAPYP
jgi:hypothetical protein